MLKTANQISVRKLTSFLSALFTSSQKMQTMAEAKQAIQKKKERTFDPIRSLFYDYQHLKDLTLTDIAIENKQSIYEGLMSPNGPKGLLPKDKLHSINILADIRLKTIAESGMTREDVLGIKAKGKSLPLSKDPFFRLIWQNHQARENLIKDSEEYSVEKIIGLALRQNIGFDKSMVATGHRILDKETPYNKEKRRLESNIFKTPETQDLYLSEITPTPFDYQQKEPFEVFRPILKKPERIKKQVQLDTREFHWRNTEFLSNFMTNFGHIKHGRLTGLSKGDQRKVTRVIKHSRKLGLLPQASYLKPHHRQSLKTLEEDLINEENFTLDFENGAVVKETDQQTFEFRTHHFNLSHAILKGVDLSQSVHDARELENAKDYALYLRAEYLKDNGVNLKSIFNNANAVPEGSTSLRTENMNEEELEICKKAYHKIGKQFAGISVDNFVECLISEKADDVENLDKLKKDKEPSVEAKSDSEISYDKILKEIALLKKNICPEKNHVSNYFLKNKDLLKIVGKLEKAEIID